METLTAFIGKVVGDVIQPLIALLFALGLFLLVYGIIFFFNIRSADPKELARGRSFLMWGVIGFFIMAFGMSIVGAVTKTFCGTTFCKQGGGAAPIQAPASNDVITQ